MPRLRASRPRSDSPGFPEPKCYPPVYLREISEYSPLGQVGKGETWRPDRHAVACRPGSEAILIAPSRGHPRKHHPACLPMPSRVGGRGPRRETTDPRTTGLFAATRRISSQEDLSGSSSPGIPAWDGPLSATESRDKPGRAAGSMSPEDGWALSPEWGGPATERPRCRRPHQGLRTRIRPVFQPLSQQSTKYNVRE